MTVAAVDLRVSTRGSSGSSVGRPSACSRARTAWYRAVVPSSEYVEVWFGDRKVAETRRALRVLETSQAPGYYLPLEDVLIGVLEPVGGGSWCEWKGNASYFDVAVGPSRAPRAAWAYHQPSSGYEDLAGHVAFYPQLMQRCLVDGEAVRANGGDFYGGWITSKVAGPFKGESGTRGW